MRFGARSTHIYAHSSILDVSLMFTCMSEVCLAFMPFFCRRGLAAAYFFPKPTTQALRVVRQSAHLVGFHDTFTMPFVTGVHLYETACGLFSSDAHPWPHAGCLFYSDGFRTCRIVAPFGYSFVPTINTCSTHISASHAAGGEPPLLMHRGATHPCTNSAARAAGGEKPPLRAHLGDPQPAQVPQLERPRRAHAPLTQSHKFPRALTAYAPTHTHFDVHLYICTRSHSL